MKRVRLALLGLLSILALATVYGLGSGLFGRAEAAAFHVNFDRGRDDQDGLSPTTAWKHAPGDPKAGDKPARTRLRAGDIVIFAANVRYRGAILVTDSGTATQPIVFMGATPEATAVIDGSEPVRGLAPCHSAQECGGAPQWNRLVRISPAQVVNGPVALFSKAGPLRPAQGPDPVSDFYRDEPGDMALADGKAMVGGSFTLPTSIAAGLATGGGRVALWVKPNRIVYRPILSVQGDTVTFDPTGLQFYTDRPSRAAAIDHISLIDRPGEYIVMPGGQTVVAMLAPGATEVSLASGRGGFQIRGASHIVIRNLGFENMADGDQLAPGGVAVFTDKRGSTGITIENNRFRNFVMERGQGPIIQRGVVGLRIVGNRFDTMVLGSGMRLTGSDIVVADNEMRGIGRTGIMLMETRNVTVRGNHITDVRGVHGNGISAYLDNRDVRILGNTVTDAKQPATFHGDKKQIAANNIVFANNLFVATPDALGALISWGSTKGVDIRNNVLLGGKAGLRLSASDTDVTIVDNVAAGLIVTGGTPTGWRLSGNVWTALTFQQKKESPKPAVSALAASLTASLERGRVPEKACAVVTRQSLSPLPGMAMVSGAVGAQLRCP